MGSLKFCKKCKFYLLYNEDKLHEASPTTEQEENKNKSQKFTSFFTAFPIFIGYFFGNVYYIILKIYLP